MSSSIFLLRSDALYSQDPGYTPPLEARMAFYPLALQELSTRYMSTYLRNILLICFRIKALSPKNLPYILCKTVLRNSRSLGSSLLNNSSNCNTNCWSIYFFAKLGWKSGDSSTRRKNSCTICKCGHEASSVGSSSSGSKSGLSLGGNVRNMLQAI